MSRPQDEHYLAAEADAFFERNREHFDPSALRATKRKILDQLAGCAPPPRRVLEFGCNYGDLLAHYATANDARAVGVEPSGKAVAFGREHFGDAIDLHVGTIADNPITRDPANRGAFDLVIVDDVLCWVSRETIFESIAAIDAMLADGGHLFLREFLPLKSSRNRNHHVEGEDVWCYKPSGPHATMFTAAGTYAVVSQTIELDTEDAWVRERERDAFESRWQNAVLRKSLGGYWD